MSFSHRLSSCDLSERSCAALSSVLSSQSSSVKHLDLSNNDLQDSGVEQLCKGLMSPHCKLDYLRLSFCGLSEKSCAALSSVLSSQSSSVKHLDLSNNNLQDSGVKLLCEGLKSPHCKLDPLRSVDHMFHQYCPVPRLLTCFLSCGCFSESSLSGCVNTDVGGASLASDLSSNSSSVRELDLSDNHPGDSAVKLLSQRLHTLR
uniref:NACHT, LRR and PYD domains-containing protein 12 n=1 Tax=Gouania willdenowi TaxID=441366 RepID=A0A8C5N7Z4_GOUWI